MFRNRQDSTASRFVISGALAMALVAGFAGTAQLTTANARSDQSEAAAKAVNKLDRAVAKAEETAQQYPRDAGARATLGGAYLAAGRFDSAASAFQDAVSLGDTSGATALRLALAHVGAGHNAQAVSILDTNRDGIPAGDLGLALALAGETSRGVAILADALRAGDNSPKLRQNLAYAYALDGRWSEARLMASQDVPADKLDARISAWAIMGKPEDYQARVAGLLGAPVRPDSGQPAALALNDGPAPAAAPTQFAAVAAASAELPASDPSREFSIAEEPAAPAVPLVAEAAPAPTPVLASATASVPLRFTSEPMIQAIPARSGADIRPPVYRGKVARAVAAKPAGTIVAKPSRDGTHSIQLGSFSSEANAQRAIKIFKAHNPELKNYQLTITPAVVRGKNFWRVSAGGFSQFAAVGMCSTVHGRGAGCFAYASVRSLPGAVPLRGQVGPLRARR